MKHYVVDVDITMSCRIEMDAESEEQAKVIAANLINNDPLHYARDGHYVSHEFEAVNETEDDETTLGKAIQYVRDNMSEWEMDALKAEMEGCYEMHLIPDRNVMDCDRVVDLLREFGDENDLPEGWWESECDFDEILTKL